MIKLNRTPKPKELTEVVQKNLTEEFKNTGNSVWNKTYIKKELLEFSNDKCSYCETNIKEESKYLEVEHFHHKDLYKDEVVDWSNLLPACKRCNGSKGVHDTKLEPIIDPTKKDPKNHLKLWRYRIKGIDELGKMTISVLNLNDQDRLVTKRFLIGNAVQDKLEHLNELIDDLISGVQTSTRRKNRIINGLKDLLKEGNPPSIYAGTTATIILTEPEYLNLRMKLKKENLWDTELESLEKKAGEISLEIA